MQTGNAGSKLPCLARAVAYQRIRGPKINEADTWGLVRAYSSVGLVFSYQLLAAKNGAAARMAKIERATALAL